MKTLPSSEVFIVTFKQGGSVEYDSFAEALKAFQTEKGVRLDMVVTTTIFKAS